MRKSLTSQGEEHDLPGRTMLFVKPLGRRTELASESGGTLIMTFPAPPEKEKSNREIVRWIAKKLGQPSSHVRIIAGLNPNRKVIEICGIDKVEYAKGLGIRVN